MRLEILSRLLLFTLLGLCCVKTSEAQSRNNLYIPFQQDSLWGYMNFDKEVVVAPQFDSAGFYDMKLDTSQRNFAVVYRDHKCGIIGPQGKLLIDLIYDSIVPFSASYEFGVFGTIIHQGSTYQFDVDGRVFGTMDWEPLYYCLSTLIDNDSWYGGAGCPLSVHSSEDSLNVYIALDDGFNTESLEDETLKIKADSFLSDGMHNHIILTGNKYYICHNVIATGLNELSLECLSKTYDEIKYILGFRHFQYLGNYLHVRKGSKWGLVNLSNWRNEGWTLKSIEIIEPKYTDVIIVKQYSWVLVERSPKLYGYVYIGKENNQVVEYW